MKKRIFVVLLVLLVIVAGVLTYNYTTSETSVEPTVIRVSGNIEATEAEVSFKIPGRVESRAVTEGEIVNAGQTVAELDRAELDQEVALRSAEVRAAQAALAELLAGRRRSRRGCIPRRCVAGWSCWSKCSRSIRTPSRCG